MSVTPIYVKQITTRNYVQPRLYTKHQITLDQKAALDAAASPDADNPFATIADTGDIEGLWEAESDGFIKPLINPDTSEPRYVGTEHLKPKNRTETAAFNLQSGDEGARIRYTEATDIDVTVYNSLELFQPITIEQAGAGVMTIVGDTDVTVQGLNDGVKSPGQYGYIQIEKVADNVINVIGGVA